MLPANDDQSGQRRPQDQSQSLFFTKLPPEIRWQIQDEYIADYLRTAAVQQHTKGYIYQWLRYEDEAEYGLHAFSADMSPLSLSCRRMFRDMSDRGAFGLFVVAPPRPIIDDFYTESNRIGLVVEGKFEWDKLRRLRFVREGDSPVYTGWQDIFRQILERATMLAEVEIEWDPKMSIVWVYEDIEAMRHIASHPSIHTVHLRGNVPRSWLEMNRGEMKGKEVIIEPLWWIERDVAEVEEVARIREESLLATKAKIDAFHAQRLYQPPDKRRWLRLRRRNKSSF